jgi:hypothetical protein
VHEREVPPQVEAEEVRASQCGASVSIQAAPFGGAVLHLHHMRDRVHRPGVGGIELGRAPAGAFGGGVVAGFLQPKACSASKWP